MPIRRILPYRIEQGPWVSFIFPTEPNLVGIEHNLRCIKDLKKSNEEPLPFCRVSYGKPAEIYRKDTIHRTKEASRMVAERPPSESPANQIH
jgi:hypothetical protein